jgi:hypothetical protein
MCDFSDGGRLRTFKNIPATAASVGKARGSELGSSCQGRRYSPSGQAVQSVRAGGTVCQGRRCSLSGQAVQSVRAGGTVCQGRLYSQSGQAVQSVRAGSTEHPSQYKLHLPGHSAPAYLGRTPFWAISLRPSAYVFQTIQHSITCCFS